ncbi:MAG: DUF3108 domain-containing protein [Verrucomicrobiales bacterium]
MLLCSRAFLLTLVGILAWGGECLAGKRAFVIKDSGDKRPAPAWVGELYRKPAGKFPPLEAGRLVYEISWSDVLVAGRTEIRLGADEREDFPGKLLGSAEGSSRGLARLLWPYDHSFESVIDPLTLRPLWFFSEEIDRRETLHTTNVFAGDGVIANKAVTVQKRGAERVEKNRVFDVAPTFDLLSMFLFLRSLPLARRGEEMVFLVHPFSGAYVVRFTVLGREKHRGARGKEDAIVLDVDISTVRKNRDLKKYTKLKKATIWVSDDARRIPLEIRAEIFVGSIRVRLVEWESLGAKNDER